MLFGLIGLFFALFFLVSPFLIYSIFNKIKHTDLRLDELNRVVEKLRGTIEQIESRIPQAEVTKEAEQVEKAEVKPEATSPRTARMIAAKTSEPEAEIAPLRKPVVSAPETRGVQPQKTPTVPGKPSKVETGWGNVPTLDLGEKIKTWLLGGNTVARVGAIILFFGVAFLLKYAADQGLFPIEIRLMAAALGGMVLITFGWLLRTRRPMYALVLQGGGIGIVYLTVFAAISLYELIPATPGLMLMVVLVMLSSALAVLQDARSLAVLAAVGGFLAPVLISRGGSHITLFSYYAALNVGILAIAWYKAWRELNLIGFFFTFVIATAWGYQYYQPEYFRSTEPFLILFFVFYVAVPVLFAQRQPPNLKGYIDGSLIFGVPLVGFGLQSALVRDFEYGLAISALGVGLFYATLATALWQKRREYLRMLVEVFIALAVAFGTLAIPLAVDGRWTGAAWALEGAALVWIGVRQNRLLALGFGVLVQHGAGAAFIAETMNPRADVPVFNSFYLGALMVSVAGLFSAFQLFRFGKQREPATQVSIWMLIWGLFWWFGAGGNEIRLHVEHAYYAAASLVFATFSLAGIAYLRRRLAWPALAQVVLLLLLFMIGVTLFSFTDPEATHPFANWGLPSWVLAFSLQYWLLKNFDTDWEGEITNYWHLGTFWLLVFIVTWEAAWFVGEAIPAAHTWQKVVWAIVPTLAVALMPAAHRKLAWPLQRFETSYLGTGLAPLIGLIALWAIVASFQQGDPHPLAYVPIVNPLELTQLFILVTCFFWLRKGYIQMDDQVRWYTWNAVAFLVLNSIIARAMHFYGGIPFEIDALWGSPRYQTAVSIIWTLAAFLIMVSATRLKQRLTWVIGSVLLGAVVIKLFLVDLADIGTIARIVSFLAVGILILLIGFLSPIPPAH